MVQNLFRIRKENTSKLNLLSNIFGFGKKKTHGFTTTFYLYIQLLVQRQASYLPNDFSMMYIYNCLLLQEPMGIIDLKRCVTEKVGLIPRDICARPNTFELVTVRQPRRGEEDTLVSKTYNTMTSIRLVLASAIVPIAWKIARFY